MEKTIKIDPTIFQASPHYTMLYLEADVVNQPTTDLLKQEMHEVATKIAAETALPDINKHPLIAATRKAYKALGKDPNRYRPSQEQLMRRIVRGLGLYHISNLVDIGNLLSLQTGCSIGIFDRDKIEGDTLTLGVGRAGEPYEGIGRGQLNIKDLPVVRDAIGGIATPTSDNERTKVSLDTRHISICLHIFDRTLADIPAIEARLRDLLRHHTSATNMATILL